MFLLTCDGCLNPFLILAFVQNLFHTHLLIQKYNRNYLVSLTFSKYIWLHTHLWIKLSLIKFKIQLKLRFLLQYMCSAFTLLRYLKFDAKGSLTILLLHLAFSPLYRLWWNNRQDIMISQISIIFFEEINFHYIFHYIFLGPSISSSLLIYFQYFINSRLEVYIYSLLYCRLFSVIKVNYQLNTI